MGGIPKNLMGISLCRTAPAGLQQLTVEDKHCHFIGRARKSGPFYISMQNISCPLARFHLGIGKPDLKNLPGILVGWGDAADQETALSILNSACRITTPFKYVAYFSYPAETLNPDVIIKICNPQETQQIVKRYSSLTGESVNSPISGIGAACGECTAYVLTKQLPTVSVGCGGSRPGINLEDDEIGPSTIDYGVIGKHDLQYAVSAPGDVGALRDVAS